jgi:hypothetical protein
VIAAVGYAAVVQDEAFPHAGWQTLEGRIEFVTSRDGRSHVRGREWVRYDRRRDGSVLVHAISVSDAPTVRRDVYYTLASDFRPLEAFVRIEADGAYEGTGWFRFQPGAIEWQAWNARDGASGGRESITGTVGGFCAHPVSTDALLCAAFDRAGPNLRQTLANVYSSSSDPFGRSGPRLVREDLVLERLDSESIATPLGPLPADHFRLTRLDAPDTPLQDLWCLAGTAVFLHGRAAGPYGSEYRLVALSDVSA